MWTGCFPKEQVEILKLNTDTLVQTNTDIECHGPSFLGQLTPILAYTSVPDYTRRFKFIKSIRYNNMVDTQTDYSYYMAPGFPVLEGGGKMQKWVCEDDDWDWDSEGSVYGLVDEIETEILLETAYPDSYGAYTAELWKIGYLILGKS